MKGTRLFATLTLVLVAILLSSPAILAEPSCTRHVHYLTDQYNFANGNMWFDYLDMDSQERGISRVVRVPPGEQVTISLGWTWGTTCPSCAVNVNAIGDWAPKKEIARLFSGVKGKVSQSYDYSFSFDAPEAPGEYKLRILFTYGDEFASDFDARNMCTEKQCREQGECHLLFAEGTVNVTTDASVLHGLEITSPKAASISEKVRINVGARVPINARLDDPSSSIAVKVDGSQVSGALPYEWNTLGAALGEHSIEIVATDGAGNVMSQEITVMIYNASESMGEQPPLVWSYEVEGDILDVEISSEGQDIATATTDGTVYMFYAWGDRYLTYQSPVALKDIAMSSKGDYLAIGEGSEVYVLKDGSRVWNYSGGQEISVIDMSSRGDIVALGAGNTVHVVRIGRQEWNYTLMDPVTSIALNSLGDHVAIGSGSSVYLLRNGSQAWNYTAAGAANDISITSAGDLVAAAFGNEIHLIKEGKAVWNRSIKEAILGIAITSSGDRIALASNKDIYYIDRSGNTIWKYQKEGELDGFVLSANGEYLASYKNKALSFLATEPGLEKAIAPPTHLITGKLEKEGLIEAIMSLGGSLPTRLALLLVLVLAVILIVKKKGISLPGLPKVSFPSSSKEEAKPTEEVEKLTRRALRIRVVNSLRGTPIKDASVRMAGLSATTGPLGDCEFPEPKKGKHTLSVEGDLYKTLTQEIQVAGDGEEFFELELEPNVRLSPSQEDRLGRISAILSRGFGEVSTFDACIPTYYRNIGEKILAFVEDVAHASKFTYDSEGREVLVDDVHVGGMEREVASIRSEIEQLNVKKEASKLTLVTISKNFEDGSMDKPTFSDLKNKYEGEVSKLSADIQRLEGQIRDKEKIISRYGEGTVDHLIDVAEDVVKEIVEVMTDWRNVKLYRALKAEGKEPEDCGAKAITYDKVKKLLQSPHSFGESEFASVKNRNMTVDSMITGRMKELTIAPVSGLWGIGNKALNDSMKESGVKKAFLIAIADIILSYSEDMLENPVIVERLKSTIF